MESTLHTLSACSKEMLNRSTLIRTQELTKLESKSLGLNLNSAPRALQDLKEKDLNSKQSEDCEARKPRNDELKIENKTPMEYLSMD